MRMSNYAISGSVLANCLILLIAAGGISGETFEIKKQPLETKKKDNTEILVNRRFLVLDFVNSLNSADYSYHENSIPDYFFDPLDRIKLFEILPRSLWKTFKMEEKFQSEDTYIEKVTIEAGKYTGADVVIMRSYTTLSDQM